jgi:hypothetical protein
MARLLAKALLRFDLDSMTLSVPDQSRRTPNCRKFDVTMAHPELRAQHGYVLRQIRESSGVRVLPDRRVRF